MADAVCRCQSNRNANTTWGKAATCANARISQANRAGWSHRWKWYGACVEWLIPEQVPHAQTKPVSTQLCFDIVEEGTSVFLARYMRYNDMSTCLAQKEGQEW